MEIDLELTDKSAKNTQRWGKLTATIVAMMTFRATRLLPMETKIDN